MAEKETTTDAVEFVKLHAGQRESLRAVMRSPAVEALARMRVDLTRLCVPSIEVSKRLAAQMKDLSDAAQLSQQSAEMLTAMKRVAEDAARFQAAFQNVRVPSWIVSGELAKALCFDSGLGKIIRDLHEHSTQWREQTAFISARFKPLSEQLAPFARQLQWLQQEEQVVLLIQELGFVPHTELWAYVANIDMPSDEEGRQKFSEQLAASIWPQLKERLILSEPECLEDRRLFELYEQMIKAHEAGLYECVCSSLVTILERVRHVGYVDGARRSAFEWLEREVGHLPMGYLGGIRGYRVWHLLITQVFASCWSDMDADVGRYPNRHARAHGIGSKVATLLDSLNSILLAHFVIGLALAVNQYREDCAA